MAEFHFDEIVKVVNSDSQVVYDKDGGGTENGLVIDDGFVDDFTVSRIIAKSEEDESYLELDVNSELYPMLPGEKYRMVISNSLLMDGSTIPGYFPEGKQKSLADKFEYVMHGLLYKMSDAKESTDDGNVDVRVVVYISFGGLQLMLKGDPLKMRKFKVDQKLFLLLRKI